MVGGMGDFCYGEWMEQKSSVWEKAWATGGFSGQLAADRPPVRQTAERLANPFVIVSRRWVTGDG
jgi:hypothetical protein